jgi:hypothetical protein
MENSFRLPVTYFLSEGKANLRECLKASFEAAVFHGVQKIVIFTSSGEGVRLALEDFISRPEYSSVKLVAVTFPTGMKFTDSNRNRISPKIPKAERQLFAEHHVRVIKAHLPFEPIKAAFGRGFLGQDLCLIGNALGIFGGGMSLCVQAILMACDAGAIKQGDHVISMTSDTSILARASCTEDFLSDFIVRQIVCKPAILTIGKKEQEPPPLVEGREAEGATRTLEADEQHSIKSLKEPKQLP